MTRISTLALAAALVSFGTPAFAAQDCAAGYKKFMDGMTTYIDTRSGDELAAAIRKSLVAFDSCKAGDSFSPHGVWDKILADMKTKSGQ